MDTKGKGVERMTENKQFTVEFDGHQYFLVIDEVNERCLARLDTRMDALAWLEMYKIFLEENEQLKQHQKNTTKEFQTLLKFIRSKGLTLTEYEKFKGDVE